MIPEGFLYLKSKSFMLKNILSAMHVDWDPPSNVLYITPTHTSSMQQMIKQGMKQKLEKSCFRCKNNNWHVELYFTDSKEIGYCY